MWTLIPGVPIGCRSPRKRGPYSMPNDIHTFIDNSLLASAMVKLTDHDSLSRETVRRRLAENHLKPWQKDTWCIPKVDAEYVGSTRRRWPVAIAASSDRAAALAHAVDGDGHVERALAHRHGRYGEIPGSGGGRPSD